MLLTSNVRLQKYEVESITSAFLALDYFVLPLLVTLPGKSVPLQVTGTSINPYSFFAFSPLPFLVIEGFKAEITGGVKAPTA